MTVVSLVKARTLMYIFWLPSRHSTKIVNQYHCLYFHNAHTISGGATSSGLDILTERGEKR